MVLTSDAIMVFDYTTDPTQSLPRILMGHSGLPVTFLISGPGKVPFPTAIFGMAETRVRTFIVSTTIARAAIDPELPVSWMEPGNVMPGVPGDISVASIDNGSSNVTFDVTLPDKSNICYNGHGGTLSVASTQLTLDKPGQSITM